MENKGCPNVFVQCFLVVSKLFLVEKDWRIKKYYKNSKTNCNKKMYNGVWVKYKSSQLKTKGVSHHGLAIYIKKYLKKNYGNSNSSTCKNIIE